MAGVDCAVVAVAIAVLTPSCVCWIDALRQASVKSDQQLEKEKLPPVTCHLTFTQVGSFPIPFLSFKENE